MLTDPELIKEVFNLERIKETNELKIKLFPYFLDKAVTVNITKIFTEDFEQPQDLLLLTFSAPFPTLEDENVHSKYHSLPLSKTTNFSLKHIFSII